MSVVRVLITREGSTGREGVPGTLRCAPTRARTVAGDPDETVLPAPFALEVGPTGRADVSLAATGPSWCWLVSWRSAAGSWDEWVAVPESATPIGWPRLVRVDPATLAPAAAPDAAWDLALTAVGERVAVIESSEPVDATQSVAGVIRLAGDLGGIASAPTVPGLSTIDGKLSALRSGAAASDRARLRAAGAYVARPADGLPGYAGSSGVAIVSEVISATTPGTSGDAWLPLWSGQMRAVYTVTCTKSTLGSRSTVGVSAVNPGANPGTLNFTFGYKAGAGLGWVRDSVGADQVAVADSEITDGDQYLVELVVIRAMATAGLGSARSHTLEARYTRVGGATTGRSFTSAAINNYPTLGGGFIRTNTTGGLSKVSITTSTTGPLPATPRPGCNVLYSSAGANYNALVRFPATSNGLMVIALHGHGSNEIEAGWGNAYLPAVWDRLCASGYTVIIPGIGTTWGNPAVIQRIADLHAVAVDVLGLDPGAFVWGDSMGGGAALTLASKGRIQTRAVYVTEPVCDLSALWPNPSFATLPAAYGGDTALRDAHSPVLLPPENFAGIPVAFCASPSDTVVPKATHTDVMMARLAGVTETALFATTGAHAAAGAYRPVDPAVWFAGRI